MAGFKAEAVVERLEYDFGSFATYSGRPITGITPEPTDDQIAAFHQQMAAMAKKHRAQEHGVDPDDRVAVLEWLANRPPEEAVQIEKDSAEIYAQLCSHKPSYDEIMAVPPRIRQAWYGWMAGEIHPEGARSATRA
jgi:hypothetical protein